MPSPFVVGRPLRANEEIFGREDAFTSIHEQLARFGSINVVGERRMGKTSLLCHLLENPSHRPVAGLPPLVLAKIDLQGGVTDASHFYGHALRAFIQAEPLLASGDQAQRLQRLPSTGFDEFEYSLRRWRMHYRPVLVIDEFERLLDPAFSSGFPFPAFFESLRALITADNIALLVASRLPLSEHFEYYPTAMTSTFPNYLQPVKLDLLNGSDADQLLLQRTGGLGLTEIAVARNWAGGHPCRLQCAGQAWYEARQQGHDAAWAERRYRELMQQACLASVPPVPLRIKTKRWLKKARQIIGLVPELPGQIVRLVKFVATKIEQLGTVVLGILVVAIIVGIATGNATAKALFDLALKKILP